LLYFPFSPGWVFIGWPAGGRNGGSVSGFRAPLQ